MQTVLPGLTLRKIGSTIKPSPHLPFFHASCAPAFPRTPLCHASPFHTLSPLRAELGRIPIQRVSSHEAAGGFVPIPASHLPTPHPKLKPSIWRPVLFCTLLSGLAFAAAAEATNRDTARWRALLKDRTIGFFGRGEPLDAQLSSTRRAADVQSAREAVGYAPSLWTAAVGWWIRLPEGKQTAAMLIGVNAVVFLAWQVRSPELRRSLIQHWMHYPLSGRSHTILTSTFSHSEFWHFSFNMIAMYSLASTFHDYLSRRVRGAYDPSGPSIPEATSRYHFLAFMVTAGLFSGLATHIYSLLVRAPRLLKWSQGKLAPGTKPPQPILPSLGISGAVYACLTGTALAFPDASVSLIFLPMFHFSIGPATLGVVMLDLIGLIRGWRMFDHAAHLGGALFGVIWYYFGGSLFDRLRLLRWKEIAEEAEKDRQKRSPPSGSLDPRRIFNPSRKS